VINTIALAIFLANIEYMMYSNYAVVRKGEVVKQFYTLNAKAQCEHYVKWYGLGSKCIKLD